MILYDLLYGYVVWTCIVGFSSWFVGSLDSGSTTGARQQHFFLDVCSLSRLDHRPSLGTANRTKVQLLRLLQTQKEKTLGLRLCNDGGSAFLAKVYSGLIQNLLISWYGNGPIFANTNFVKANSGILTAIPLTFDSSSVSHLLPHHSTQLTTSSWIC